MENQSNSMRPWRKLEGGKVVAFRNSSCLGAAWRATLRLLESRHHTQAIQQVQHRN